MYEGVDYQEYWNDPSLESLDELERRVAADLLPECGRRLIDIGCGYGRMSDCYAGRFEDVILFDGSPHLLRQARERKLKNAAFIAGDFNHLPFKKASFDAALVIRVVQHMTDLRASFKRIHRILCQNGRLTFSYHNKLNARRVLRWLISREKKSPFTLDSEEVSATLLSRHPKVISRILQETGFCPSGYRGVGVFDRVAARLGPWARFLPSGEGLSPLLGQAKLAPWIFENAVAKGNGLLAEANSLEDILQCPSCGGNVRKGTDVYECLSCKLSYPIRDGIIDFRI